MSGDLLLFNLLIVVVSLAIGLAVMYLVIKSAVSASLRAARREAWTETFMPEKADWLTERQRAELRAQLDGSTPDV